MRNYKSIIAYDGSRYKGWQRQPDTPNTIQGILESNLEELTGYSVNVNGSGRTDGGVHAKGQVASFYLGRKVEDDFRLQLNEKLPEDIRVLKMELVKNGFHARKSATGKCYEYLIDTGEQADVFQRKYCCHWIKKLDIKRMEEAAEYLIGRHDFSAFTDRKENELLVRKIKRITVKQNGQFLKLEFYGGGFLYHMVRIITGTLLEVGAGEKKPEDMRMILASKDRNKAGFLAPAQGLFLQEVEYKD